MTSPLLVPNSYRYNLANLFVGSFANSNYYLFVGDNTTHANLVVQPLTDTTFSRIIDVYANMTEGKRIAETDVQLMIRNVPYETDKVFVQYDHSVDLTNQDFYAVVNASSYYHIFKCLDNNRGSNSTVEPNFADISGANSQFYQTSDGYTWKYMYSVTDSLVSKFGTDKYFPIQSNTTVQDQAVSGAVSVISIDDPGYRYDNYVTGIFVNANLRVNGDPHLYEVANSLASTVNGYYTGCLLYLSDGTGRGQYSLVSDYFCNENGNFARIVDAFDVLPTNGTAFQIYPNVKITGSGRETINAVARALVNALASNSIYKVEVLNQGADYNYITANVVANNVVASLRPAKLRPIYAPPYGHGWNAAEELFSNRAEISVKLANNENATILTSNKFQQVGVIKNPLFDNVAFSVANVQGAFVSGEIVHKMKTFHITDTVSLNTDTVVITAANGQFTTKLAVGDFVYLTDANNTINQLGVVASITNSTSLNLTSNGFFQSDTAAIFSFESLSQAKVLDVVSALEISLTDVQPNFLTDDLIIGEQSGCLATIDTISRNDVEKGFATFIQLYKYSGLQTFGSFIPNEIVYQDTLASANALLHTAIVDGNNHIIAYTSNQIGQFHKNMDLVGKDTGSLASIDKVYSPELVFGTGDIIYLENLDSVERQPNQTETFKISFSF